MAIVCQDLLSLRERRTPEVWIPCIARLLCALCHVVWAWGGVESTRSFVRDWSGRSPGPSFAPVSACADKFFTWLCSSPWVMPVLTWRHAAARTCFAGSWCGGSLFWGGLTSSTHARTVEHGCQLHKPWLFCPSAIMSRIKTFTSPEPWPELSLLLVTPRGPHP